MGFDFFSLGDLVRGSSYNTSGGAKEIFLSINSIEETTFPEELKEIRSVIGEMPLLVPGIGVQGGDVERAVMNGRAQNGTGMIINSSRGIIYSCQGDNFAEAARMQRRR